LEKIILQNSAQKGLEVGVVGREACYATTQGAVTIRRGGDDANVIFRREESQTFRISYGR
jgi:hypothetical protein